MLLKQDHFLAFECCLQISNSSYWTQSSFRHGLSTQSKSVLLLSSKNLALKSRRMFYRGFIAKTGSNSVLWNEHTEMSLAIEKLLWKVKEQYSQLNMQLQLCQAAVYFTWTKAHATLGHPKRSHGLWQVIKTLLRSIEIGTHWHSSGLLVGDCNSPVLSGYSDREGLHD